MLLINVNSLVNVLIALLIAFYITNNTFKYINNVIYYTISIREIIIMMMRCDDDDDYDCDDDDKIIGYLIYVYTLLITLYVVIHENFGA